MPPSRTVQDALREAGAVLVRANKHHIYQLPNGARIVMSATPGDRRADQNILRDLRHLQTRGSVHGS